MELAAPWGRACATSLALTACAAAQREAAALGGTGWCAWVDPSRSLYALGAEALRVDLAHLLLAVPSAQALPRTAVRIARSHVFSVVVVDASALATLAPWPTVIRRLALAVEGTGTTVLLLTALDAHRALPLPTASRIELSRRGEGEVAIRVAKDRHGRVTPWRRVAWGVP